jgi:hypothetical protein
MSKVSVTCGAKLSVRGTSSISKFKSFHCHLSSVHGEKGRNPRILSNALVYF